jgi:hypothetical protein
MKKHKGIFLFLLFLLLLLLTRVTIAQNQIPVSVVSSGGENSSSTVFILCSTVGEAFIGKTISSANQLNIGFWYVYEQSIVTDVQKDDEIIPAVYKLEQNYPNPFNPTTIIKFGVPERSKVVLKLYDILGKEIITLLNEEMEAGWYRKEFNGTEYASGIYIYRLNAGSYTNTKKMILVK